MQTLRSHAWVIGLAVLLAALFAITKAIQPSFGASGLESLARAALPFAFATAGMAVVVIVGGIDLSVASMMAVCAVTTAVLMERMAGVPAVLIVLLAGLVMGLINGALIVLTRVPDIVVTLAMLFVWEGTALLILESPGGRTADWLQQTIRGGFVLDILPKAFLVTALCIALVWVPIRRSKLGSVDLCHGVGRTGRLPLERGRGAAPGSSPTASAGCFAPLVASALPRSQGSANRCRGRIFWLRSPLLSLAASSLVAARAGCWGRSSRCSSCASFARS